MLIVIEIDAATPRHNKNYVE